ncbi:PEP/pyruvate-binding domain-containing protein [Mesorhizobium sp.]|jgi:pyruvate,orthophosphate dikinase|uniref:PEP/pyruvate-binding domain-containing protein n=1 Tax=Mesorhizobium sp. TaxID=1871066 RepID=UPI00356476DD
MNIRPEPNLAQGAPSAPQIFFIGGTEPLSEGVTSDMLGFKAFNLAGMAAIGLRVPPAFVLGTQWCARQEEITPDIWRSGLDRLETATDLCLGDARKPLLLSVRSGAPVSMPGMMETLLNIGLTDATLPGIIRMTGNPRLAWDAFRRLVASYGEVVAGVDSRCFDDDLENLRGDTDERELDFVALRDLARMHLETFEREAAAPFPQSAEVQLREAILAVFRSWNSEKASAYRELRGLSHAMGTAVTVQRMVFGNAGGMSGAGVGFTRNPSNGDPAPWVDFLFNAQGEDVVSGRRSAHGHGELAAAAPQVWAELVEATKRLERHFQDMQDFEFTVQDGQLYLLQTRTGKRTPQAAARIALDLLDEGLIDRHTALERTQGLDARSLAVRVVTAGDGKHLVPIASASSASSGVVCGEIALDEVRVRERKAAGCAVILVRRDAETRDISALDLADGLLTQRGARTSHAAVVARQLGKVCLVGCDALSVHETDATISIGDLSFREGDKITLDGNEGHVYAGITEVREQIPADLLARLDKLRESQA